MKKNSLLGADSSAGNTSQTPNLKINFYLKIYGLVRSNCGMNY
jgi:hypothetical protein